MLVFVAYGKPNATPLAAAYGWGIARNQAFIDGNKRTAFVAAELLLRLNGYALNVADADAVVVMLGVAAGDVSEDEFAGWIRKLSAKAGA